ncbi:F-box-like domain-containing protein [Microdochium nivale]|nr:F-box-like domain-containing protein [Microdochium nivale]
MPPASLQHLPNEILRPVILSAVDDRRELAPLRLVCKQFNAVARPEFWKFVALPASECPRQILRLIRALQIYPDAGTLVRDLVVDASASVDEQFSNFRLNFGASRDWIATTYSEGFGEWLQDTAKQSPRSFNYALAMLVVHMPKLEYLSYGLYDAHEQSLLPCLFDLCSKARSPRARHSDNELLMFAWPLPLMHLKKLSLANNGKPAEEPLYRLSSLVQFPVRSLMLYGVSLFPFSPKWVHSHPDVWHQLRMIYVQVCDFQPDALKRILTACPDLLSLWYLSDIPESCTERGILMDMNQVGDTLREYGGNLRSILYSIRCGEPEQYGVCGRIGSLRSLTSLNNLTVNAPLLLGAGEDQLDLVNVLPSSVSHLELWTCAYRDLVDPCCYETTVARLLRNRRRFPSLVMVRIDWAASEPLHPREWTRWQSQRVLLAHQYVVFAVGALANEDAAEHIRDLEEVYDEDGEDEDGNSEPIARAAWRSWPRTLDMRDLRNSAMLN